MNIQYLITFLIRLIAYVLLLPPVGYFRAWVAKKMGDTLAEERGYLTLNPFVHVPIIGVVLLFIFGLGVINLTPINPASSAYNPPWRRLKLAIVAFSGVLAYVLLAVIAVAGLAIFIAKSGTLIYEPFNLSLVGILASFAQLATFFAILEFFMYSVFLMLLPLVEDYIIEPIHLYYGMILIAIILIFFFGESLETLLTHGISSAAEFLVHIISGT